MKQGCTTISTPATTTGTCYTLHPPSLIIVHTPHYTPPTRSGSLVPNAVDAFATFVEHTPHLVRVIHTRTAHGWVHYRISLTRATPPSPYQPRFNVQNTTCHVRCHHGPPHYPCYGYTTTPCRYCNTPEHTRLAFPRFYLDHCILFFAAYYRLVRTSRLRCGLRLPALRCVPAPATGCSLDGTILGWVGLRCLPPRTAPTPDAYAPHTYCTFTTRPAALYPHRLYLTHTTTAFATFNSDYLPIGPVTHRTCRRARCRTYLRVTHRAPLPDAGLV